jgi:hypothetical protein
MKEAEVLKQELNTKFKFPGEKEKMMFSGEK